MGDHFVKTDANTTTTELRNELQIEKQKTAHLEARLAQLERQLSLRGISPNGSSNSNQNEFDLDHHLSRVFSRDLETPPIRDIQIIQAPVLTPTHTPRDSMDAFSAEHPSKLSEHQISHYNHQIHSNNSYNNAYANHQDSMASHHGTRNEEWISNNPSKQAARPAPSNPSKPSSNISSQDVSDSSDDSSSDRPKKQHIAGAGMIHYALSESDLPLAAAGVLDDSRTNYPPPLGDPSLSSLSLAARLNGGTIPTGLTFSAQYDQGRRRYDESSLKLSLLHQELDDFKHLLVETQSDLILQRRRNEWMEGELCSMTTDMEILKSQILSKNKLILKLIEDLKQIDPLKTQISNLNAQKVELQINLDVSQKQRNSMASTIETQQIQVHKLNQTLKEKELELQMKAADNVKLAEKLVSVKSRLDTLIPHLCQFNVSTVGGFLAKTVVASIGVLKPAAGRAQASHSTPKELEIVVSGSRKTILANQITSIQASSKDKAQFSISYSDGKSDIFASPKREEVINTLSFHLFGKSPASTDPRPISEDHAIVPTEEINSSSVPSTSTTTPPQSQQRPSGVIN